MFAVQRLPALCTHCKQQLASVEEAFALLRSRLPHLEVCLQEFHPARNHGIRFFQPGTCSICRQSGRSGDIAAFDVFKSAGEQDPSLQPEGRLTLEEYMLRLAALGHLALHDLLGFLENDQLRRAYNLLTASEQALTGANASLNHKLAELEAANRVLVKRTEVLVSLQVSQSALPLHQLCEETFTCLAAFQGESEQFDDMTLVVMEVDERTGIYPDR